MNNTHTHGLRDKNSKEYEGFGFTSFSLLRIALSNMSPLFPRPQPVHHKRKMTIDTEKLELVYICVLISTVIGGLWIIGHQEFNHKNIESGEWECFEEAPINNMRIICETHADFENPLANGCDIQIKNESEKICIKERWIRK